MASPPLLPPPPPPPPPPHPPPSLPSAATSSPSFPSSLLSDGILTLALPAPNAPPRSNPDTPTIGAALLLPPPPPSSSSTRRIPPPCWSHDETLALISSYKNKWDSLRRGVLRAPDWDDVAASVSRLCHPEPPNPTKTPLQCRHKIEKLRKRYRAERQRAARANPSAPPRSTWLYFKKMDEIGLSIGPSPSAFLAPKPPLPSSDSHSSASDDGAKRKKTPSFGNGRLRLRLPVKTSTSPSPSSAAAPRYGNEYSEYPRRGPGKRRSGEEEEDEDEEVDGDGDGTGLMKGLVSAVRRLADGYMRMEHMNIDMMREMEKMRMEMELKQTEMMLDTQRRIVDAFVRRIGGKKGSKVPPDC